MINAVLIDDEPDALVFLNAQLERSTTKVKVVGQYTDPQAALEQQSWKDVDVVLLDMEMPSMNGFQFLDTLGVSHFGVIFTTAHEEYALGAIKRNAVDYLLKPVEREELELALQKIPVATPQDQKAPLSRICVPTKKGFEIIELPDLIWLEASNNYTYLHLEGSGKSKLVSRTLRSFEKKLTGQAFCRVNQSHMINMAYVQAFDKTQGSSVRLTNGKVFTVSPTYKQAFLTRFSSIMM